MTTSACNGTKIKVFNQNVTYMDGSTPQAITIVSAGPTGTQGGNLTDGEGNPLSGAAIVVDSGASCEFIANSSEGSNGNFDIAFDIQCNAATSSTVTAQYQSLEPNAYGECSMINSKNCNVGGSTYSSTNFTASVTNSSPSEEGQNWINISVANGGSGDTNG